ncbi:MAG TPA: hypothetical protein VEU08_15890 [Vicinamibacterales bacterium]|nr:hypothetical protein [Vicinamibacterales bacterium]
MRRLVLRAAAIAVVAVFASLPTLTRIHDHLTGFDNPTAFRISKNLERPHEKSVAPFISSAAPFIACLASPSRDAIILPETAPSSAVVTPADVRGPPAA